MTAEVKGWSKDFTREVKWKLFEDKVKDSFRNLRIDKKTTIRIGTIVGLGAMTSASDFINTDTHEALAVNNNPAIKVMADSEVVKSIKYLHKFDRIQKHSNSGLFMEEINGHEPVKVCHSTSSDTNPYVEMNPDCSSVEFSGHKQHSGGVFPEDSWGDIFPAGFCNNEPYDGMNWPEGQVIYDNGCEISATSTPEHTPTQKNTPTPENTPTQAVTATATPRKTEIPGVTPTKTTVVTEAPEVTPSSTTNPENTPTKIVTPNETPCVVVTSTAECPQCPEIQECSPNQSMLVIQNQENQVNCVDQNNCECEIAVVNIDAQTAKDVAEKNGNTAKWVAAILAAGYALGRFLGKKKE